MSGNNKLFGLLSMCRRAGKAELGFDSVKESMEKKKARLVLIASDTSAKTEKEIRFFADKYAVPVLKTAESIKDFGLGIGKNVGVVAVCDEGFAKKTSELVGETTSDGECNK